MPSYERNKKYAAAYRAKIERIDVFVPQGQKQIIKNHAAERGESMNEFITRAINAAIRGRCNQDRYPHHRRNIT